VTEKINNNDSIHHLPRIKWACRRGMLELDVLLGNFVDNGYLSLSDEDKLLFIKLLESPDPELFAWLMGAATPAEQDFVKIIRIMKDHGKAGI
jgi:antitoxin CptB